MATKKTTILSVSLPADLRVALDAAAQGQRRSRSFVVGEAIRAYLTEKARETFTAARDRTLREGLALTPAERVTLAEELWQDFARGRQPSEPWTAAFDTFDQYERWRRQGKRTAE
jgi:predicted transcriptional regulator